MFFTSDTWFDSRKRHGGLDAHNGFDSHNGHDSHDKFSIPGQDGKSLILPGKLLLADASMVFFFQLCRYTVCKELV